MNWWKKWKGKYWDEAAHSGRNKDGSVEHIPHTDVPPLRASLRKMKSEIQEKPLYAFALISGVLIGLIGAIAKLVAAFNGSS